MTKLLDIHFSPGNDLFPFAIGFFLVINSSCHHIAVPLASLFLLPLVFVFMFVGELVNVSESVFVFDEVPLLVALFEIVGLFVLLIPGKRICPEVADIDIRLSPCPLLFLIHFYWFLFQG